MVGGDSYSVYCTAVRGSVGVVGGGGLIDGIA